MEVVFYYSSSVSWVSGSSCSWCVCVFSLLSVVLYTRIGVVLLSPCAWVHCISCGYSLEYVLYAAHCPLDFALCEFVHR